MIMCLIIYIFCWKYGYFGLIYYFVESRAIGGNTLRILREWYLQRPVVREGRSLVRICQF